MPTSEQSQIFVNFVGGLNTEATALNFPENSATEIDNMDLFRQGDIRRRLGVDFEDNFELSPHTFDSDTFSTDAISTHEWRAVNNRGELDFLVVQVGLQLFFHDLGSEPISGTERGTVDLTPFQVGQNARTILLDTSFGEGRMMVANRELEPLYVEFDEVTQTFTATQINIEVRDFDGLEDNLPTELRPANLSPEHEYNLRNQGWPLNILAALRPDGDSRNGTAVIDTDPIQYMRQFTGVYPSNADIVHLGKLGGSDKPESLGAFHPAQIEKLTLGNTPASRGHFIFSPFNRDRTGVSQLDLGGEFAVDAFVGGVAAVARRIEGLPEAEVDNLRPSVTEFYAGRVWFAGVPSALNGGDVFFSQSITDINNAGKCYQEQDPTAEDLNQLLATDGGVIHISDMGRVQRMINVGQDLVLLCSNGVWAIAGEVGAAFSATSFAVRKISDVGTLSRDSVLEVEGNLMYWNEGGIYQMTSGQISDTLTVERISRDTIQSFYEEIGEETRAYVRGFYDDFENKVYWFYNDTPDYDAINFRFQYNRCLVYDLTIQAFYPYTFSELAEGTTPMIASMTQKTPGTEEQVQFNILVGLDDVIDGADDICQSIAFPSFADTKLKMLTFVNDLSNVNDLRYTFSEFNGLSFFDWTTWDTMAQGPGDNRGADYLSLIQTGFFNSIQTRRGTSVNPLPLRHLTHVTSYFNRTEDGFELDSNNEIQLANPSGALVQTRWEWTDNDTGRWTKQERAYRLLRVYIPDDVNDDFNYGEAVIKTKLRMRGKGHAFSIRYESEPGKDMQLLGFGVNLRAGTKL